MWKIIKEIAGIMFLICILINAGQYYYKKFNPTCTDSEIIEGAIDTLNSIESMSELKLKVTGLNNIEETYYNRSTRDLSCKADAVLSNKNVVPVTYNVNRKKDVYYFEASNFTCSDASIVSKITDMLNSSEIISELKLKVTALNDVQESLYDIGRKTALCTANAALSNGKSSSIEFRIVDQGKEYDLEAQFTGIDIPQLIFEQLTEDFAESLTELGEDNKEDEEDNEVDDENDEEENDED